MKRCNAVRPGNFEGLLPPCCELPEQHAGQHVEPHPLGVMRWSDDDQPYGELSPIMAPAISMEAPE